MNADNFFSSFTGGEEVYPKMNYICPALCKLDLDDEIWDMSLWYLEDVLELRFGT